MNANCFWRDLRCGGGWVESRIAGAWPIVQRINAGKIIKGLKAPRQASPRRSLGSRPIIIPSPKRGATSVSPFDVPFNVGEGLHRGIHNDCCAHSGRARFSTRYPTALVLVALPWAGLSQAVGLTRLRRVWVGLPAASCRVGSMSRNGRPVGFSSYKSS